MHDANVFQFLFAAKHHTRKDQTNDSYLFETLLALTENLLSKVDLLKETWLHGAIRLYNVWTVLALCLSSARAFVFWFSFSFFFISFSHLLLLHKYCCRCCCCGAILIAIHCIWQVHSVIQMHGTTVFCWTKPKHWNWNRQRILQLKLLLEHVNVIMNRFFNESPIYTNVMWSRSMCYAICS